MSDLTIPAEFVAGAGVAVTGVIGALWRQLTVDRKRSDTLLSIESQSSTERLDAVEKKAAARIAALEDHVVELQDRWAKEVRRGAALAMMGTGSGPPASLPQPEWEERTAVRDLRRQLEHEALSEALNRYLHESTPPHRTNRPKG
jgi:hypothetical protein